MIITESPTDVDEQFLYAQLNQFNDQYRTKDGKLISIYIKDANGKIVAGLSGLTFLTWLQVDVLWVNEMERGKNIGSELLAKAKCIAIDRDCIGVNIETYIPKPPEDAGSGFRPDARSRRNMQRMVIPFSNVTTQS